MESHYAINVSLNGMHLFETAPRSGVLKAQATKMFDEIRRRFPASEGFQVDVIHWDCVGRVQPWE